MYRKNSRQGLNAEVVTSTLTHEYAYRQAESDIAQNGPTVHNCTVLKKIGVD